MCNIQLFMSQFILNQAFKSIINIIKLRMQIEDQNKEKDKKNNKNRVRVAIRVRPMIQRQSAVNQNTCIQYSPPSNIIIGKDRCFTFDHVFNQKSSQAEVYEKCVKQLVLACFQGYNAAILAYGQTGSGKTHTMGTGAVDLQDQKQMGIVPRVIKQIFYQIQQKKQSALIIVKASFIEIYNQQIIDLLGNNNLLSHSDQSKGNKQSISKDYSNIPTIRQQKDGSISLVNVIEETVKDCQSMLALLQRGGCNRSTASTLMNDCSSRSHGIFAIQIQQHPKCETQEDQGFITAKFYFVDLAGSERAKKTGASGLTLRQGININLGLLELGNVISALSSTQKRQNQFISYRNSKLTRILQDSLGGNSNTYMISCISPAQSNYQQSLNTIKYATKAMNIKNKPVINRDPHSAQVNALKERILQLELENKNMKKLLSQSGIAITQQNLSRSDPRTDILSEQIKLMRMKLNQSQRQNQYLQSELKDKLKKKNQLQIQNYELKRDRDKLKLRIQKQRQRSRTQRSNRSIIDQQCQYDQQEGLIEQYQNKIRQLQIQVFEQQKLNNKIQQQYEKLRKQMKKDEQIITNKNKQIVKLRTSIKLLIHQKQQKQEERTSKYNDDQFQKNGQSNTRPTIRTEKSMKDVFQHNVKQIDTNQDKESSYEFDEQIDENQQFMEAQADYKANNEAHNQKLMQVEYQIKQQQQKLQAMTEDQINLEYQLISQMKQQYHKKIMVLEKQKLSIIKQQQEMAGYEKNPKLKQKVEHLQLELRQLRKKAKQQNNLLKQVSSQNEQIKKLANQIKVHKVQKIQINRKIKEDKSAYDKFKKQRMKQIIVAKKQNVKKQKQIRKLELQNKKKSMQMHKKDQQISRFKKLNESMKNYQKHNKKQLNRTKNQDKNKRNLFFNSSPESQYNQILMNIHRKAMQYVFSQQQSKIEMEKYDKKIAELEEQIQKIIDQEASLQFKLDKIQINAAYSNFQTLKQSSNFQSIKQSNCQRQHLISNISQLKQRITLIEENIVYYQNRYNQLGNTLPNFDQQADIINNLNINNLNKMQTIVKLTYQSLRNFVYNGIVHFQKVEFLTAENKQLKDLIQKLREQLSKTINEHQMYISRMREQMMNKYYSTLQEQNYQTIGSVQQIGNLNKTNNGKMQEREKKNYQRKIIDLTKINRQLSADVQMWRRKCSVVQQKYHNINAKVAKDKFIGRPREQEQGGKKNTSGWNIGGVNSLNSVNTVQMIDQVNQMIDKIQNKKKTINTSQDQEIRESNRSSQQAEFSKNRWQCLMTLKALRSPILSMAVQQNLLITSGTKSINIWDIQSCKLIADLSNPNCLQGFVKSVIAIPQQSYMAAACEKQVFIWDYRTYKSMAVLKAHKDEVRCLYSLGNCLFSGGKGTPNGGSLLMWDLRMLDNLLPFDQKQKNFDVFAMTSHNNILYYGTRNHQVRRISLQHRDVLSPFEPPHMDTVTSLSVFNNYLISGSKDKNLRLWALQSSSSINIRCTSHAFNDYVNVVESDKQLPIFYAGSRDGQVKIATVVDEKIKFVGGIIAHTQSISSICQVGYRSQGMFLTSSIDKTVKFWKPDPSTIDRISINTSSFNY